jgi:hypothetical protein
MSVFKVTLEVRIAPHWMLGKGVAYEVGTIKEESMTKAAILENLLTTNTV